MNARFESIHTRVYKNSVTHIIAKTLNYIIYNLYKLQLIVNFSLVSHANIFASSLPFSNKLTEKYACNSRKQTQIQVAKK